MKEQSTLIDWHSNSQEIISTLEKSLENSIDCVFNRFEMARIANNFDACSNKQCNKYIAYAATFEVFADLQRQINETKVIMPSLDTAYQDILISAFDNIKNYYHDQRFKFCTKHEVLSDNLANQYRNYLTMFNVYESLQKDRNTVTRIADNLIADFKDLNMVDKIVSQTDLPEFCQRSTAWWLSYREANQDNHVDIGEAVSVYLRLLHTDYLNHAKQATQGKAQEVISSQELALQATEDILYKKESKYQEKRYSMILKKLEKNKS